MAVSLLSIIITNSLIKSPVITDAIIEEQLYLENIDFVSNDDLDEFLEETDLTPLQEAEVIKINTMPRLQALKISFLILASVALLAIIPAGGLPNYVPDEVPAEIARTQAWPRLASHQHSYINKERQINSNVHNQ